MARVFLSHSSKDKSFVRPIAQLFGADKCVFDEMTFEVGMRNIDEIFNEMDSTDIFVYFISDNSLNSEWVNDELNLAKDRLEANKLEQIFPIIIDENINYDDDRIAEFLKVGKGSYNLRHINNYKLAYKKICSQLLRMQMDRNIKYKEEKNFFYGRDLEIKKFKDRYDDMMMNPIKCLIVNGIEGVGRKSYGREALKSAKIIKPYYFPSTICLEKSDTIEDVILKISDLGFGDYTLSKVATMSNMDEKIDALSELLKEAQKYKEHIFIDDNMCLVSFDRCLPYWFDRALEKIDNTIVITIATNIRLDSFKYRKKEYIFTIDLDDLEIKETLGFLRAYSESEGVEFEREDCIFLKDCLTGYPPQIKYCVELAKEYGISYVKDKSYKLYNYAEAKAVSILNAFVEEKNKEVCYGFLSFLSHFDAVPLGLLYDIKKTNNEYGNLLINLINFSICRYMGSSREYIKVNSVIQDYIQRQKIDFPDDIKAYLEAKVRDFNENIDNEMYTDLMDFMELSLYIRENLKQGRYVPEKFLYSTVFLKTVIELYNNRKTDRVITLVRGIKDDGTLDRFDNVPKSQILYYYCEALARKQHEDFIEEVEYFRKEDQYVNYNFLKGFNYRIAGKLELAESSYRNVLDKNGNYSPAKRELVTIYRLLDEYNTAFDLAKDNYKKEKKNIYHMHSYFDCLMRKQSLSSEEEKDIEDILKAVEELAEDKEKERYYQIKASYLAYYEKQKNPAIELLKEGLTKNPGAMYLAKEMFDIYEKYSDIKGMSFALENLEKIIKDERSGYKNILIRRQAILDAYNGKTKKAIEISLEGERNIGKGFLEAIMKKVDSILSL